MNTKSTIPFGPQHPVLPEPLNLKLVLEDEKIVEAVPSIGYVHRGLEKLAETKDFNQTTFLMERICGICSAIHGQTFVQGVEKIMNIEIPDRAKYLRVIWGELHRIHSHLLWLGLFADAFGFESLFMQCWRDREKVMDIMEATSGARVVISVNKVGGVKRDISSEHLTEIVRICDEVYADLKKMENTFLNDYTVRHRTEGVGYLTKEQAYSLGAVGPMARACGVPQDLRTLGYAAYGKLGFQPVMETTGDCWGRTSVRIKETYESCRLVKTAIADLPAGDIAVPVKGNPSGEVVERTEQPRGEVVYYIKGNGTKNLERVRVRTPTFANIPTLLVMLPGSQLADVPVILLTIDPCISCTER